MTSWAVLMPSDVFAVGGDGVDAGEAFGGNLLGGLALSDGADNLRFRLGQDAGAFFLDLLLVDDDLQSALTDVTLVAGDGLKGLAHLAERSVLEDDAELMGGINHLPDEGGCQFVADEYPLRQRKTFTDDEQLFGIGKIEQREASNTVASSCSFKSSTRPALSVAT